MLAVGEQHQEHKVNVETSGHSRLAEAGRHSYQADAKQFTSTGQAVIVSGYNKD